MNNPSSTWPEISGIDTARAQEICLDDPEFYKVLLHAFVHEAVAICSELTTSLANLQAETSCKLLHKLRGMSANLGASGFHQEATNLEEALKRGLHPENQVVAQLQRLIDDIQRTLATGDSAETTEAPLKADGHSLAALAPQLDDLKQLLADNNLAVMPLWANLRTEIRSAINQAAWTQLDHAISMLQFAEAGQLLVQIRSGDA